MKEQEGKERRSAGRPEATGRRSFEGASKVRLFEVRFTFQAANGSVCSLSNAAGMHLPACLACDLRPATCYFSMAPRGGCTAR